jgi:hypothetical protein
MRRARLAALAGLLGALPAYPQAADVLRNTLEGRTVVVKIDMPAIELGVEVAPSRTPPIDEAALAKRMKEFGVAIGAGTSYTLSKIIVSRQQVEVLLGWGGAPFDKEQRLPDMGSRLRLLYPEGVPAGILTLEGFTAAVAPYLDLSTPTRSGAGASPASAAGADDATVASLRAGLTRSEVEALLGSAFEVVRRQEGDRLQRVASYRTASGTLEAVFEGNRLVRWTLEPR